MLGTGGFMVSLEGSAMLLQWPMIELSEMNMSVDSALSWIGGMSGKNFASWWNRTGWHHLLDTEEVAWIPYGFSTCMINASATEEAAALWIPYPCPRMYSMISSMTLRSIHTVVEEHLNSTRDKSIQKHLPLYLEVLRTAERAAAQAVSAAPPTVDPDGAPGTPSGALAPLQDDPANTGGTAATEGDEDSGSEQSVSSTDSQIEEKPPPEVGLAHAGLDAAAAAEARAADERAEQHVNPANASGSGSREHEQSGREAVGDSSKRAPKKKRRVS